MPAMFWRLAQGVPSPSESDPSSCSCKTNLTRRRGASAMWPSRLVTTSALAVLGLAAASTAYAVSAGDASFAIPFPGSLTLLSSGVAALAGVAWWLGRKK